LVPAHCCRGGRETEEKGGETGTVRVSPGMSSEGIKARLRKTGEGKMRRKLGKKVRKWAGYPA